jgi:hypothetical protein
LKAAGLIEEADPEFDAWVRIYNLRPEPMADLKAWLEHRAARRLQGASS